MNKPQTLINYEMYLEGASSPSGIVDVTLPNVQAVTQTMEGAGQAGPTDVPVLGHTQDMTATVNYKIAHDDMTPMLEQKYHQIEFWSALQDVDTGSGELKVRQHKVVMKMMPKGDNLGTLKSGEAQGRSIEFSVVYLKETVDGKLIREIDKFNFIYKVGEKDLLEKVRAAVGL